VPSPSASLQAALGGVIRDLRRSAGLSQEGLADRSGLHRTYISQLERGIKSPTLAAIEALAIALDTRLYVLLKAAEERRA
jgi:transcriptional regulator with XRE-family HTH domain